MNAYTIMTLLTKELSVEFITLIPVQRAKIDELMDHGKITQYTMAIDRSTLWGTVSEKSEAIAKSIISSFPLIY